MYVFVIFGRFDESYIKAVRHTSFRISYFWINLVGFSKAIYSPYFNTIYEIHTLVSSMELKINLIN